MKLIVVSILFVIVLSVLFVTFFMNKSGSKKPSVILTFLGAPGSGKGTLAGQCVEQLNMQVLSTGNLCRQAIARQDERGKFIEEIIKKGKLIPDEMISDMVKQWLNTHANSEKTILLDGYPRTAQQAELLRSTLKEHFPSLQLHVISIAISDDAIINRISNRLMCENKGCQAVYNRSMITNDVIICQKCQGSLIQREDDKESVVRQRLNVYAQNNDPLVELYHEKKIPFHALDVNNKTIKKVFESFKQLYQSIK